MCGWHVHMQITCEQCPDATCRENHQCRLSHKSFIWSWNETTHHSCGKFHSITRSCQSRKIVYVHVDHEECCRWCADDMCMCEWRAGADDVRMQTTCTCGRRIEQLCIKPTGLLVADWLERNNMDCLFRYQSEIINGTWIETFLGNDLETRFNFIDSYY